MQLTWDFCNVPLYGWVQKTTAWGFQNLLAIFNRSYQVHLFPLFLLTYLGFYLILGVIETHLLILMEAIVQHKQCPETCCASKQAGNWPNCLCDPQLLRCSFLGSADAALCQSINFKPRANKPDKGLREKLPSRLCQHGAGEPSWLPSSQMCRPADSLCPLCSTRCTVS